MNRKAFTLIEVVIALAILAIGLLGLVSVLSKTIFGIRGSGKRTKAVELAMAKMEELKNRPFYPVVSSTYTYVLTDGSDEYSLTWVSVDSTPVNNCKRLDVTVTWTERNRPQSVTLSTVVSKYGRP